MTLSGALELVLTVELFRTTKKNSSPGVEKPKAALTTARKLE
jgi:hypothetical protein